MPTRIAILGREKSIATLARKIYRIEGEGAAELQGRAEAALLAANPRLASRSGFRSGAAIVVPSVRGLELSDAVVGIQADGGGLTGEAKLRLQGLASRMEDGFQKDAERRAEALSRLSDRTFLAEARAALPESNAVLKKLAVRLAKQEEETKAEAERLAKAVDTALEGLETLEKLGSLPGRNRP